MPRRARCLHSAVSKAEVSMTVRMFGVAAGITLVLSGMFVSSPARAQVDGIINLMGQAIQMDMQRQQYERQRAYQEQQRREAIRQEQARRQAEINAIREQEAVVIRRVQTALAELGFYKGKISGVRGPDTRKAESAYCAAFGLAPFEASDAQMAQLEALAAKGFRSPKEAEAAATAGFSTRKDMAAAQAGGFSTARDYAEARAKGFEQREEYLLFLQSGLSDRTAFLQERNLLVKRKEASDACVAASAKFVDPAKAVETCLDAINLGVTGSAFTDAYAAVGQKLEARMAEAAALAAEPQKLASTEKVKLKDARKNAKDAGAGAVLEARMRTGELLKAHACGEAVLNKDYPVALSKCRVEAGDLLSVPQLALLSTATEQEKSESEKAAAEQARLALEAARSRAAELLRQVEDFASAQRFGAAVDIAKAIVAVRQSQSSDDAATIQQANQKLETYLAKEVAFQTFVVERERNARQLKVNAAATAQAELTRLQSFLQQYIADNILDKNIDALLALQADLAAAQSPDDVERTIRVQRDGRERLYKLGLQAKFDAYKIPETSAAIAKGTEVAGNGLAVNVANEALLKGEGRDVLVLGNFTAWAPHLIINLVGETAFDGRRATTCWFGDEARAPESTRAALQRLKAMGVDEIVETGRCDAGTVGRIDVVLLQRDRFLASDLVAARALVERFEKGDVRLLHVVAWSEIGATAQNDDGTARTIEADIGAGARAGFGLITFKTSANRVCLVVAEAELPVHELVVTERRNGLDRFVTADVVRARFTVERVFVSIQRQECSAVYAEQADLKALLTGLQRAKLTYAVVPVWLSPDDISAAAARRAELDRQQQAELASRKQTAEGLQQLEAEKQAEQERVRAARQAELRTRYGQEAAAATNELADLSRRFFASGGSSPFRELFPRAAQWRDRREADHWDFTDTDTALVDYGTAEWKGRRTEVVFIEARVSTRNRALGENATTCFVLGYLIDAEFKVRRDPLELPCADEASGITAWTSGRAFESRWLVSAN
ncbi:hypothetical protein AncyloWKF20_04220 [Ancylobacter sp. WKF20]|uniref:hypothetical protein n=1 Tax=Ancylobacter sp. WKF20 TaxID=3039801 RepID=UPI002434405E|nr:hypothetical protein [Ancylobacter sp. WKF20]WGD31043.1 hypothetical protein AncyloWKF20_04220 [Ancylobacter sp. WKF20]